MFNIYMKKEYINTLIIYRINIIKIKKTYLTKK